MISCTIDKRRIEKADELSNPYHIALGFCLDMLFSFLEEKGEEDRETHVVVESRGTKEDKDEGVSSGQKREAPVKLTEA